VSVHRATNVFPQPSGWRVICTCGHECRGIDRAAALDAFHDHAEHDHLAAVEEVGE
jgi:hypothetical protein